MRHTSDKEAARRPATPMIYNKSYFIGYILLAVPIVGLLISFIYTLADPDYVYNDFWRMLMKGFIPTFVIWTGCIGIVTTIWKKFPWEQYPVKHLIYEVLSILVYLSILLAWLLFMSARFDFQMWERIVRGSVLDIFITVLITFLITAIHEAFYFYKQWKANFSKSVRLEKDHLQAQYNTLKAQVNPHFLFNSLNSLISLVEGNQKAEKFIQDLSDYLRFVLQNAEKETITLQEELENLDKYIGLMSIRFGSNFTVSEVIQQDARDMELPPLVLLILLENCVTHNVITQAKPLHVSIEATTQRVTVTNNLQKKSDSSSTGQGLANIQGRYRFSSTEEVKICVSEDTFSVSLPLISPKI